MKNLLKYYLLSIVSWMLVFSFGRLVFHAINFSESSAGDLSTFWGSFVHGLRLDLSMSAYLVFIPFLFLSLILLVFKKTSKGFNGFLQLALLIPSSIIIAIDAQLFRYWGFKLDLTPFRFIQTGASDAAASIRLVDTLLVFAAFAFILLLALLLYKKLLAKSFVKIPQKRSTGLIALVLCAILFVPIRGSFDVAPISVSSAYFHKDHFPNQAAINPVWNFMYALTIKNQDVRLNLCDKDEATKTWESLYGASDSTYYSPKPTIDKPNVILVVLESFSAKLIEPLGGTPGLTPRLNKLCSDGVLFTNYYASGDRSDMGLASMFTGYPAMPNKHLLAFPQRLQSLPNICKTLAAQGYTSSFFYGGNLEFANINSLFITGGVNNIITQKEMPSFGDNGKWGVHDEHVFELFANHIKQEAEPFFASVFSLSSHEPYKVPATYKHFKGNLAAFNGATYYTDSCLGVLVDELKTSGVWDKSIVIITADHATRMPDMSDVNRANKFRIPLLLTGGAIDTSYTLDHLCSQSDLALTVLNVLGLETRSEDFPFSKNMFDLSKDFALYYYNKGVAYLEPSGSIVYDIRGDYSTLLRGSDSAGYIQKAKAVTQAIDNDFASR
jgi:phosphoglycerol transferase MdoB-like AlkP superfamily enzyme